MRYMMFIKHPEDYRNQKPPQALMDAMGVFVGDAMKNGVMLDGAGLKPLANATRVRLSRGNLTTTDGPFSEAKEVVGGYALIEAKSKEDAVEIATKFMELHRIHWPDFEGESELRPLEDQPPE